MSSPPLHKRKFPLLTTFWRRFWGHQPFWNCELLLV